MIEKVEDYKIPHMNIDNLLTSYMKSSKGIKDLINIILSFDQTTEALFCTTVKKINIKEDIEVVGFGNYIGSFSYFPTVMLTLISSLNEIPEHDKLLSSAFKILLSNLSEDTRNAIVNEAKRYI